MEKRGLQVDEIASVKAHREQPPGHIQEPEKAGKWVTVSKVLAELRVVHKATECRDFAITVQINLVSQNILEENSRLY